MAPTKMPPLRMCAGCGARKPKRELVRVVRTPDGDVRLDMTGKAPGRGAYLCRDSACLAKAVKARRLERAFSAEVPKEVFESLAKEMEALDR